MILLKTDIVAIQGRAVIGGVSKLQRELMGYYILLDCPLHPFLSKKDGNGGPWHYT